MAAHPTDGQSDEQDIPPEVMRRLHPRRKWPWVLLGVVLALLAATIHCRNSNIASVTTMNPASAAAAIPLAPNHVPPPGSWSGKGGSGSISALVAA